MNKIKSVIVKKHFSMLCGVFIHYLSGVLFIHLLVCYFSYSSNISFYQFIFAICLIITRRCSVISTSFFSMCFSYSEYFWSFIMISLSSYYIYPSSSLIFSFFLANSSCIVELCIASASLFISSTFSLFLLIISPAHSTALVTCPSVNMLPA